MENLTDNKEREVLVGPFRDGDSDGLDGDRLVERHLPPALRARLGREAASRRVLVHSQVGDVVPERGRLQGLLAQGQVPA